MIIGIASMRVTSDPSRVGNPGFTESIVWPKATGRDPVPPEVPDDFAKDYREACLVLADSPQASAALSRRCLQHILREKSGVGPSGLAKEIERVVEARSLPPYLAEALDEIRVTGNFAAHPIKYRTGEVVPVEPGEAERNLDILERLFEFYFVQPALAQRARDDLNRKLAATGKPLLRDGCADGAQDSRAAESAPPADDD